MKHDLVQYCTEYDYMGRGIGGVLGNTVCRGDIILYLYTRGDFYLCSGCIANIHKYCYIFYIIQRRN